MVRLFVHHQVTDLEAARAFATSQRLREVMREAGVIEPPALWTTEQVRAA